MYIRLNEVLGRQQTSNICVPVIHYDEACFGHVEAPSGRRKKAKAQMFLDISFCTHRLEINDAVMLFEATGLRVGA